MADSDLTTENYSNTLSSSDEDLEVLSATMCYSNIVKIPSLDSRIQPLCNMFIYDSNYSIEEEFIYRCKKGIVSPNQVKERYKVIFFSTDFNTQEVTDIISNLNPRAFSRLFVFVFEVMDNDLRETGKLIQGALLKFSITRPLLLQVTSEAQMTSNFYAKHENSHEFYLMDIEPSENEISLNDFKSVLQLYINAKLEPFLLTHCYRKILNIPLAVRFLKLPARILPLRELTLECLRFGNKKNLMDILDVPFEENGSILCKKSESFITSPFVEYHSEGNNSSLLIAIEYENESVTDYLMTNCAHLFSFEQQLEVTSYALENHKLDLLCDLLEFCDYPFPPGVENYSHERLSKIVKERKKFHKSVNDSNLIDIYEFIFKSKLKIVYNTKNESALRTALRSKNFLIFYELKSIFFHDNDIQKILDNLEDHEKEEIECLAQNQMKLDSNPLRTPEILFKISRIYNVKKHGNHITELNEKIKKWFLDIYETSKFLDVCVQSDNLDVLFDFDSDSVSELFRLRNLKKKLNFFFKLVNFSTSSSGKDRIIIGAKPRIEHEDKNIEGILAYELCRYAMRMVFENNGEPYFESDLELPKLYSKIVENFQEVKLIGSCNNSEALAFQNCLTNNLRTKLIPALAYVCAAYKDEPDKIEELRNTYADVFDFYKDYVVPELESFSQVHKYNMKFLNDLAGRHPSNSNMKLEVESSEDLCNLMQKKENLVIASNIPEILFVNICKYLQQHRRDKFCKYYVCTRAENFDDPAFVTKFLNISKYFFYVTVIIDCTLESPEKFSKVQFTENIKLIFVTQDQTKENSKIPNTNKAEQNYDWNSFTTDSQNLLTLRKMNFKFMAITRSSIKGGAGKRKDKQEASMDVETINFLLKDVPFTIFGSKV